MLDGIPLGLANVGPPGLLVLLAAFNILSLFKGWVVVKIHYDTLVQANRDQQDTIATLRDTNGIQARTIDKQTVVGETVVKVVSSIQEIRTDGRGE